MMAAPALGAPRPAGRSPPQFKAALRQRRRRSRCAPPCHSDSASHARPARCRCRRQVWATDITLDYFRTGRFRWYSPWGPPIQLQDARPGLDFVGLNYYGKCVPPPSSATGCLGLPWLPLTMLLFFQAHCERVRAYCVAVACPHAVVFYAWNACPGLL